MAASWKTRVGLLVLGTALSLPAGECFVRLVCPQPASWLAIYRKHPEFPGYAHQPGVRTVIDTGESRWSVCTDDDGFRVSCRENPVDDRECALWLGDSFAFGHGVEFEDSFVGILERDPRRRYRYVDAAVSGYGPTQYRQTLQTLLVGGWKPRVVLVETFPGNDFFDCVWSKDVPVRDGILGNESGWKFFWKRHSHLYRLLSAWLHRSRIPEIGQTALDEKMGDPRAWTEGELGSAEKIYRDEFARLAALCAEKGIPLAVLVIPRSILLEHLAGTGSSNGEGARGLEESSGPVLPWRHALEALRSVGLRTLDLAPVLACHPVREAFFPIDGHFTPRGNAWVAEAIREAWPDLIEQP